MIQLSLSCVGCYYFRYFCHASVLLQRGAKQRLRNTILGTTKHHDGDDIEFYASWYLVLVRGERGQGHAQLDGL